MFRAIALTLRAGLRGLRPPSAPLRWLRDIFLMRSHPSSRGLAGRGLAPRRENICGYMTGFSRGYNLSPLCDFRSEVSWMRYVLVDKILWIDVGREAVGLKCVSLTDDVVDEHFAELPIL